MKKFKTVCVHKDRFMISSYITIGNIYTVNYESDNFYHMFDDNGNYGVYDKHNFLSLHQMRKRKLNKLKFIYT